MTKLVEKAFGQAKCKVKAQELALTLVEAESGESVTDELIKGCGHKQPKVAGAASECLRMAVQCFGLHPLGPQSKAVVKISVSMFNSTVQSVRSEALPLAIELHRYMGAVLRPSYDDLRTAQQKEIDDAFASAEKPAPTRMTRSAATALAAKPQSDAASDPDGALKPATAPIPTIDPLELLEPVNVMAKLPKDFSDKVLALPKWTEKKELLDKLIEAADAPKIVPFDYHELVKALKKLMGDSMVVLVACSCTAAGHLAKGLRKDFSQGTKMLLATLLDRLKEKDFRVKDAVHSALDSMIGTGKCVSLQDVLDDFCTALGPKGNPKAKVEVCKFLRRSILAKANESITLKGIKPLTDVIMKGVDDSTPEVRESSCSVLGAMLVTFGADSMKRILESLDDKKRKKIETLASSPECSGPADSEAAGKADVMKKAPVKASEATKKTSGKVVAPKAVSAAPKTKAVSSGEKSEPKTDVLADLNAGTPVEELDSQIETMYPESTRTKLASSNWKERLEGMEEILASLQEQDKFEQPTPDVTCRMLVGVVVSKKETNFQVVAKAFSIVQTLSEKSAKFSKRAAHWMIGVLVDKLGDVKLKVVSSDCLLSLAESCTPNFIMTQAIEVLQKQKAPKTLENGLLWIKTMCDDFGMKLIKPKPVIDHTKQMLEVANPSVKKMAIEVLVTLRRALGPQMRNLLSDVKPALLTTIDEAFSKVVDDAPAEAPKRQVRCEDAASAAAGIGSGDEIVNLTGPISGHLKAMGDANWKDRQAAIVAIDDIVSKAKPLGCTGPYMEGACGELWASLKARLKDTNKNLSIQVLSLLGKIADAIGPSADKYAKYVMPNMLALISDNKKTVRDAVIACLSSWSKHITSETMIKYLPIALSVESPAGREDSFKFAADYLEASTKSDQMDLSPILMPVMDGLVFRVAEVRNGAERCLAAIYMCGGKTAINNVLRDMKPAQLKGVRPMCEKAEKASLSGTVIATEVPATAEVPMSVVQAPEEEGKPGQAGMLEVTAESAMAKKVVDSVAPSEPSAEEEKGLLLRCNTKGKDAREKRNSKTKWVLEDAKEVEDLILAIKDQMMPVSDGEMHCKLFNKDFKKQVEGIKELTAFVPDHVAEVKDNLDLLLNMSALRIVQKACNTSVLLAVLELVKALMDFCVSVQYLLSEYEASVILPVLFSEIGSHNEGIRAQIRDVVKRTSQVYPASKIFAFAMEAVVATRNQRSKAEVLAEMAGLIDRLGLDQVCMPSKALPVIAGLISERDSLVRNAACDCIAAAYSSIGEKIWKYVDKRLEPKDKDILEARLRKVKNAPIPAKDADMRRSMPDMSSTDKAHQAEVRHSVHLGGALNTPQKGTAMMDAKELLEAPTPSISNIRSRYQDGQPNVESIFAECMNNIAGADVEQQIDGLRQICQIMGQADSGLVKSNVNELAGRVQLVLETLLANQARTPSDLRLAKHAIHAMHTMCEKQPDAASALKDTVTGRLLEEFLLLSTDAQNNQTVDLEPMMAALNEDLLTGLNTVVMDMLHNSNPNHCFTSLIRFLYEDAILSGERLATAAFVDAVLRCLLEMARNMQEHMPRLDVDNLLYDCHLFLVSHPPSKYRGKEFRPLRLLKTILNELVKIKGEGIRMHLSLVPVENKPTLCSYIELVLTQHLAQKVQAAPDKSGKLDIAGIFEKIGSKDKEVAKEGFKLLHQYQKDHSDFDLEHFLSGRSPLFQEHVHKNLAKVAAQSNTPTSLGMPLQPSSMANLNKDESSKSNLMDKLANIRGTYGSKGTDAPASASSEEPSMTDAVVSAEDEKRASQSVLSLQERLAKLRS